MAQNPSNVIPDQLIVVEGDAGFVPKSEPSDAGKVLKVDSHGTPVWGEDSGGTSFEPDKGLQLVDGKLSVKISSDYSGITNNLNGQGIVAISRADNSLTVNNAGVRVTNPLPSSTSADADKVLTVNSSGTPEWADAQGGGGGGGTSGGTTIQADEPVKVSFTGTSTGGSFPGSVVMAGSDVLGNSPIVCIHVPKLALEYSQFSGGDFTTDYTLKLYDNNTYKADIATTKAYYSNGKYRLVFPERWLYYNTLPALESGHYYVLKVSYTALGSSNTPSGSVEFFPYNANGKYLIPDLVVDQTSILNTRSVYQTPPGMQTVSVNLDSEKGIVDKTTHSYSDTTHTLSIDNTDVYHDGSSQSVSDFSNNTEQIKGAVALSNATYYIPTSPYTASKFPVAHMITRTSGSNSGVTDFQFSNFLDQRGPEFGMVYIVHIEGPATSTGSADCPCICRFTLCENVEDWETMSTQQYYHYAVLPGVYVHSEQKVVADGVITISQTHPNGMFQSQFYTQPYIVSLDPNTTITGTFGYVSDWNVCVSRI